MLEQMLSLLLWDKLLSMPQITRNSWRSWHFPQSWKFIWNLVLFAFETNKPLANNRKALQSTSSLCSLSLDFEAILLLLPECNMENKNIQETPFWSLHPTQYAQSSFSYCKSTVHSSFIASSETHKLSWLHHKTSKMVSVVIRRK